MGTMKVKMTLLSPVHIGTGQDYEPTNFIIDQGYLYEFDETDFYRALNKDDQKNFIHKAESTAPEALFELHTFVKSHKDVAKKVARLKVKVTDGIAKDYQKKVGKAVQHEGWKKQKVFNKFQIPRTLRNPNTTYPYIPGSSIKGSLSTAIQEAFFHKSEALYKKYFDVKNPTQSFMKNLLVSDATPLRIGSKIGYSLNKERFEDNQDGPKNKIEIIVPTSEYEVTFSTRMYEPHLVFGLEELKIFSNTHYLPLFRNMMESYTVFNSKEIDDYINDYFSDSFYESFRNMKLKENQFLLRVGKHSGAKAVTIEGLRQIRVRESKKQWKTYDQETTTWLFGESEHQNDNLLPFGWVLCEVR